MKLYHGTSMKALPNILKNGIQPRLKEGEGNWEKFPSRPGFVYLTTAYAGYFSVMATNEKEQMVFPIVEIDINKLDKSRLCPDEDFIGQVRSSQEGISLEQATNECNPLDYQENWKLSIEKMGNCCYHGTIPKRAITRYAMVNLKKNPHMGALFLDPVISIMNYSIMKRKYISLMAYIFDGKELYDEREQWAAMITDDFIQFGKDAIAYKEEMMKFRPESIEVVKV